MVKKQRSKTKQASNANLKAHKDKDEASEKASAEAPKQPKRTKKNTKSEDQEFIPNNNAHNRRSFIHRINISTTSIKEPQPATRTTTDITEDSSSETKTRPKRKKDDKDKRNIFRRSKKGLKLDLPATPPLGDSRQAYWTSQNFKFSEPSQSVSEYVSTETSSETPREGKRMKFFRKSLTHREDENIERALSPAEELTEAGRVLFHRKNFIEAIAKLKRAITLFDNQVKLSLSSIPIRYALAAAHYYLADCLIAQGDFLQAEFSTRQALELLDDLILNQSYQESGKVTLSDDWVLGVDITSELLWFRKSFLEQQLGSLLQRQRMFEVALEWYQRAIFSREKRTHAPSIPASHANIAWILIQHVAKCVENDFSDMDGIPCTDPALLKLISLLETAETHAKMAIKLCKKHSDDQVHMAACSNLLDIHILLGNLGTPQQENISSKRAQISRELASIVRQSKMEKIKKDIEKIQKRIARDQKDRPIPLDSRALEFLCESPRVLVSSESLIFGSYPPFAEIKNN